MSRLPQLPRSQDCGIVYVYRLGNKYKIGFTRYNLKRQCKGELVIAIPTGQQPSQLEYLINHHFSNQRLLPQGTKPGDKREWFTLQPSDIDWLRGLAAYLSQ